MAAFRITAAVLGSDWATDEALSERVVALAGAGAAEPELRRDDYLVDLRFVVEEESEEEARNAAHRVLQRAFSDMGWMISAVDAD